MDPSLIVFAVRAFIRLGKTAVDVANQSALDQSFLMPVPDSPDISKEGEVRFRFEDDERYKPLVAVGRPLHADWEVFNSEGDSEEKRRATATLYAAFSALQNREQAAGRVKSIQKSDEHEIYGAVLIAQWGRGEGPPDPLARAVVTIADIALEYVGANPSVLGIGGQGEKLVGALASNLSSLIPDDVHEGVYGPKAQFGQRLIGLFLHAGLKTVTDNPGLVFGEKHLQSLVKTALVPVRDSLPGDILQDFQWRSVADALTGPSVNIALQTIGNDPKKFLGKNFDVDTALGASVAAILITASKRGLEGTITQEGWIALFQSVAGVAAKRPELFLGKADEKPEIIFEKIFASVAEVVETAPAPFDSDLGLQIAIAALDGLHESLDDVFDRSDAWESVAGDITGQILTGLKEGFGVDDATGALRHAFSNEQLVAFVRIFASQVAKSPEMVARDNKKLTAMVAETAKAVAAAKPPFANGYSIALVEAVFTGLANASPRVFDQADGWERVAGRITASVMNGIAKGFAGNNPDPLKSVFSRDQFVSFGRILAEEVARTPEMISGDAKQVEGVVQAVAAAMAADANLLLTAADWQRILAVAAEEAARNPDRLFGIDSGTVGGTAATSLIRMLLNASADGLNANKQRKVGSVLFGQNLVEAIVITLRAAAGNVDKALANREALKTLARDIDRLVTDNSRTFGGKEWLLVFRHELPGVIESGTPPTLTVEAVENILKGGA